MKTKYVSIAIMVLAMGALTLTSCNKDKNAASKDYVSGAGDVASISNAVDATGADAVAAATGIGASTSGKADDFGPHNPWAKICGSTTVSEGNAPDRSTTIVYDGTTKCHGVIRSGIITIKNLSGIDWNHVNAQLTVAYINLKVTDAHTGDYYIMNGTHTITNMTGGTFWKVIDQESPSGTTVTHKNVSTDMKVTYSDGTARSFTFDRMRSWNITGLVITETTFADGSNALEQGVDRNGNDFTTQISSPIIDNNYCAWNPYTGTVLHSVGSTGVHVIRLYGTDEKGNQVGSVQTCAPGYSVIGDGGKGPVKFYAYPTE